MLEKCNLGWKPYYHVRQGLRLGKGNFRYIGILATRRASGDEGSLNCCVLVSDPSNVSTRSLGITLAWLRLVQRTRNELTLHSRDGDTFARALQIACEFTISTVALKDTYTLVGAAFGSRCQSQR